MTTLSDNIVYRRVAPVLLVATLVLAIGAAVGTYVNDQNDRERDRAIDRVQTQRLEDNRGLLECFDRFATDLAGGLPPVRAATVARDEAVSQAFAAIRAALAHVADSGADGTQLANLITALDAVDAATDNLTKVRAANPYPEPPSEFCASKD